MSPAEKLNQQSVYLIIRLLENLSRRRRFQLCGLLLFMLLGALSELVTLGAVIPFLALLTDASFVSRFQFLQDFFIALGWSPTESILLPVTILFSIIVLLGVVIRLTLSWVSYKFTFGVGVDIGIQVYKRTLYQPYIFHVAHNSSELISSINKVQIVVVGVINPLIQGMVSSIMVLAILAALIFIDLVTAVMAGFGFGLIYVLVTFSTRRKLLVNSKIIANNESSRIQAVQEGFGGIRDVLIDGTHSVYIKRFSIINITQSQALCSTNFIGAAPRYIIESVGMVLIALLAYFLNHRGTGFNGAIPVLGALALGAQKLMPQMQLVYGAWAALTGNTNILSDVVVLLDQPIPVEYSKTAQLKTAKLQHSIKLNNICFRYHADTPEVLRHINLKILRGSRVGFIGKTGCGKSTLIDLIIGLLEPTAGSIEIDGNTLTNLNRRDWQSHIAHVPQSIYLSDSSILENIAFGVEPLYIDKNRVYEAARKSQLDDFIKTLPEQYETFVGERGICLSGGQRQRIGLARALYKQADILVLDEATSALDNATENTVMQAIELLGNEVTILMIAHRISTLANCDHIFEIDRGVLLR